MSTVSDKAAQVKESVSNAAEKTTTFVKNNRWAIAGVVLTIVGAAAVAVVKSRRDKDSTETA